MEELQQAAAFYQSQANQLAGEAPRDDAGNLVLPDLTEMSELAAQPLPVMLP